jgi:RNA polymerase sigma-70 factor (ECF subfamily)
LGYLREGMTEEGGDRRIEERLDHGDLRGAAEACVETYGPEVLGFLVRALRHEQDANEAFSDACEDLWKSMADFQRRCSIRTWFYTLAKHAAARLLRAPHRDPRRHTEEGALAGAVSKVRTETLPYLRTTFRDRFAEIRDALSEEDRTLLILRVDRAMSWADIARVFVGAECTQDELARMDARLRKRFQLVKQEIRERAKQCGVSADSARDSRTG